MPRLKNGRSKKKQKPKKKLVVAMVSKTSLRSKAAKQTKEKDTEEEKPSENESMNLRPKRTKSTPQKETVEKEAAKHKVQKKKSVKRLTTKKGKKKAKTGKVATKSKATKRKSKANDEVSPKKQRFEEEVLTDFHEIQSYEELKEEDDMEALLVATHPRHRVSARGKSPNQKRSRLEKNNRENSEQLIIEAVPETIPKHDSDDDEEPPEEDDDDIDDSLFFGIPTEKSPDFGNCSQCKKKFRREELADHIHNCPERYVQCQECNKVLSNLQTLERHHKRFHLKLREVPCTLCDKMFIDEAASRKHLKTVHFKVKNFHCPHCDKSFSQRNKLTYHVRTHSGEKPFACTECGRSFSLLWNLKTHLRTHTGEKPYACDICGRKFTQKQNMTSHMTTHKKPKLARSNSYGTFTSGDNLDYYLSDIRQSGKSPMVHDNQNSLKITQSRGVGQDAQYLINQLGITTTTSSSNENTANIITISQNNELENGLGLLSSVARKGDNNDGTSSNVEVDCIVDQAHLSHQVAHGPVDQVVEVLVQPHGGNGDATITISTSDSTPHETESSIIKSESDNPDACQNKEASNVASTGIATLQQQHQTVSAQNVIPIGNANLSGLANILQNPEVLSAINAAAASNKFIVIGPVGMLSGQNAGTTNTVSIATAYANDLAQSSIESEAVESLVTSDVVTDKQSQPTLSQSHRTVMQIAAVDHIDSALAASCDVEMIPADTSQDSSVCFADASQNDATGNEVQSSVPNIVNLVLQGPPSVTASSSYVSGSSSTVHSLNTNQIPLDQDDAEQEEAEVVSSQDGAVKDGTGATSSLDGEQVSSSAENSSYLSTIDEVNQADSSKDKETVQSSSGSSSVPLDVNSGGAVFNVNIASSYMNDDKLVTQSTDNPANNSSTPHIINPYSAQETGDIASVSAQSELSDNSDKVSQSYIVSLGEQFVSSSTRTSLANTSFITSTGLSGTGQSMVMVTADGQSYFTTLNLPEGFQQTGNQQIILADSMANNFSIPVIDGSIALDSLGNLQSGDTSANALFTTHYQNTNNEVQLEPNNCNNVTSELEESAVTDSTPRIVPNSSTSDGSSNSVLLDSNVENSVSGSNQIQQQVSNSLDDHVDSNSADANQGITTHAGNIPNAYAANSSANDFNAYQQALIDAADLVTGSSSSNYDSVVSGTENIVSGDSLGSEQIEAQRTGVTSSNLLDNNAEALTVTNNTSQADVDQGDSYVSTSLQVS